jgi:hypothetical protein
MDSRGSYLLLGGPLVMERALQPGARECGHVRVVGAGGLRIGRRASRPEGLRVRTVRGIAVAVRWRALRRVRVVGLDHGRRLRVNRAALAETLLNTSLAPTEPDEYDCGDQDGCAADCDSCDGACSEGAVSRVIRVR